MLAYIPAALHYKTHPAGQVVASNHYVAALRYQTNSGDSAGSLPEPRQATIKDTQKS
jgi:hypothetical protein